MKHIIIHYAKFQIDTDMISLLHIKNPVNKNIYMFTVSYNTHYFYTYRAHAQEKNI